MLFVSHHDQSIFFFFSSLDHLPSNSVLNLTTWTEQNKHEHNHEREQMRSTSGFRGQVGPTLSLCFFFFFGPLILVRAFLRALQGGEWSAHDVAYRAPLQRTVTVIGEWYWWCLSLSLPPFCHCFCYWGIKGFSDGKGRFMWVVVEFNCAARFIYWRCGGAGEG